METIKHIQKALGWIGVIILLVGVFIFLIGSVIEAPLCFSVSFGLAYLSFVIMVVSISLWFALWLVTKWGKE